MITPAFSLTATERVLPRLALDWTTGLAQSGVDVVRAGVATYVDSNNLIQLASANTQRVDWSTGTAGLLVEESRQNRLLYSQDFSQSIWAVAGTATKTASASVCPDGTTSAYAISVGTGSNFFWYNSLNITAAARYEPSIYIKRVTTSGTLRINSANGTGNGQWTINLALLGNGFERITRSSPAVTVVTEFTGTGNNFSGIVFVSASGTLNFEVWGAQIELGTFSTSYIPTVATAVTRNADVATMTGTNFSDWFNATEGTFVFSGTTQNTTATCPIFSVNDSSLSNYITGAKQSTNKDLFYASGGVYLTNNVSYAYGSIIKGAYAYKANNWGQSTNAAAVIQNTTSPVPTVNRLEIGGFVTGSFPTNFWNQCIQKLFYYPQRLINAELQAFSK